MNENIDLTKILEGCPIGTEFYHLGFGRVWFVGINLDDEYSNEEPILFSLRYDTYYADTALTKKGTFSTIYEGECLIFPSKDQRDWSKFERFWDKPKKERFNPKTLKPFDKVLVKYSLDCDFDWECDLFSHIGNKDDEFPYHCVGTNYRYCIPYNDETKHLVGTANDCPDYYKWWEK